MTGPKSHQRMHRRAVILRCLAGAGSACLALSSGPARSQSFPKSTKLQAGYVDEAKPELRLCGACVFFLEPDDCSIVEGPINPMGSCDYYED
jgi:hypothetical protein